MRKFTTAFICLTIITIQSMAQTVPGKITGMVTGKETSVENAAVLLIKAKDSTLVKTIITDKLGRFEFSPVANGNYIIAVNSIGFKKYYSSPLTVAANTVQADKIELTIQPKQLDAVTVTSAKPLIEMKADKLVVNVDASPTNAGSTALEVLEKSPGITVDKDGNISLKGKQGVTVLIDGRPSYMSGSDLANMLKGMSASQLDQLEIMTNPPAKYDASGNSGIINIKTKKLKVVGFNGSVNAGYGQGVYPKTNAGVNLNYRQGKLNTFGSFNYNYRKAYQQFEVVRNVLNSNTHALAYTFAQSARMPDTRNTFSSKIGADYSISKKTSAGISLNFFNTKMTYDNNSTNKISGNTGNLETINNSRTYMTPNVSNYNGNIFITHQFDSTGKELTFNADYIRYKDKHQQFFTNSLFDKNNTPLSKTDTLNGNLPTGFEIYAAKVDYTHPLAKKARLEMGAKTSFVTSDNNIRFDSTINGNIVTDSKRSNYFIYKENVVAGYINFSSPIGKKISVQAGLRYEYTNGKGNQVTTGTTFKNEYGQLFPTLYISYEANEKHQFSINYGRRINRPQYRDLNPFVFIIDKYTYQKGNPYLQPMFSHNIELSHSFKHFINTTLNYSKTTGSISEVVETNEATKEVFLIKKNIASQEQFGLAVNMNKGLNKWLTLNLNANVFHNRYKGIVNDTAVDLSAVSGNFSGGLQFKFSKGWDAEVNGFYNTRGVDGVSINNGIGMFSLAVSKAILNSKGKLTLNIRDPFLLQRYTGTTKFSTVDATINSRWDNRVINLSFNYRFGKAFKTTKRNTGSASEEQSRIG